MMSTKDTNAFSTATTRVLSSIVLALKGFVKALYKTGTITKSEYDNELDVIENMR